MTRPRTTQEIRRSPWYWLAIAIEMEELGVLLTKRSREEVRRVFGAQDPNHIEEAYYTTTNRLLAEGIDREKDTGVANLPLQRWIRQVRAQEAELGNTSYYGRQVAVPKRDPRGGGEGGGIG